MMKRIIAILLVCIFMHMVAFSENEITYELSRIALLSKGYTMEQADEIINKIQSGESPIPFHQVDYDLYNTPADENGLENDLICVTGTITEYFKTDNLYGIRLAQEDGKEWIVLYAIKVDGVLVGTNPFGEKDATVFDGYENRLVTIYGEYLGYSELYELPVAQIAGFGGMLLLDDNVFVVSMNSRLEMERRKIDGFGYKIYDMGYLIGAKRTIESTEKYVYWAW